jgi:serine/threonine-protein kinase HipA
VRLMVCLEGQVAGVLEASGSRTHLTYTDPWLSRGGAYPLSQSLPLRPGLLTGAPVVNFLWGLLPDNGRTLDAWARQFHVSARNPVALLACVGEDCAGAVQFVREERLNEVLATENNTARIEWLDDTELERRIRHLSQDPGAARESAAEGQFSLSGAQAKTALYFDRQRKRWGIPRGRTPTTHILKPVSNNFAGFAENEHFCLALARRIGLAAANTEWRSIGGIPTLIAERYDRLQLAGRWHRIHQEDCCQALGIHPGTQYENEGGPGFAQIMSLLEGTDEPRVDRDRLMKTACVVYLLAATDAHSKNFSLLYSRGADRPSMRLAPLYDIASAWPYPRRIPPQKMRLAMRVGRHYRVREIQPRHFTELARACRYPADTLIATLRDLSGQLPDEGSALLKEVEVRGMARDVLAKLLDGLAAQCTATRRNLDHGGGRNDRIHAR